MAYHTPITANDIHSHHSMTHRQQISKISAENLPILPRSIGILQMSG